MAVQARDTILLTKQDLGPIGETATVHKALMTDSCARICGFLWDKRLGIGDRCSLKKEWNALKDRSRKFKVSRQSPGSFWAHIISFLPFHFTLNCPSRLSSNKIVWCYCHRKRCPTLDVLALSKWCNLIVQRAFNANSKAFCRPTFSPVPWWLYCQCRPVIYAAVGVCVPLFSSLADRIGLYESAIQTTRLSTLLRLNKPFLNSSAKHLFIGHRVIALTLIKWPLSSSSSHLRSSVVQSATRSYHCKVLIVSCFFFG